jgi:hypothetical protein
VPSANTSLEPSASTCCTSFGTQRTSFAASGPASSMRVCSGLRQPTATHGFDGVNSKYGELPTSVTWWSAPSFFFIS